jgi:TatD DNase family protein
MAEEVLKRGWTLSFSGVLTYPKADELREVVKMCPLDRMVVETDCPFLAPQKHRGERNEPAFVVETAQLIAGLKSLSYEDLEKRLDANARSLFGLL